MRILAVALRPLLVLNRPISETWDLCCIGSSNAHLCGAFDLANLPYAKDIRMTTQFLYLVHRLHRDESGQDLIEYALVAALIAFAAVAGMGFVASAINNAFSAIGSKLSNSIS